MSRRRVFSSPARSHGFSLLEVLIALLVLAFGLLGFALLQTMNVRFVQSSNYRTQATNLAYDLLDQMRSNRYQAHWYNGATFAANSVKLSSCTRPVGDKLTISDNVTRWKCQVVQALGEGASANVTITNGQARVDISWGDERWNKDKADSLTTFSLVSQL